MKIIGITGGVGSGKSSVIDYIQKHYDCVTVKTDEINHFGMRKGNPTYEPILEVLSAIVLDKDDEINRSKMAHIIYADKTKLDAIDKIVFPYVQQVVAEKITLADDRGVKYFFIESALMFHECCHLDKLCTSLWYIHAHKHLRLGRLEANRNYSTEKSQAIMQNQDTDTVFSWFSDVTIDNSGFFSETVKQIRKYLD